MSLVIIAYSFRYFLKKFLQKYYLIVAIIIFLWITNCSLVFKKKNLCSFLSNYKLQRHGERTEVFPRSWYGQNDRKMKVNKLVLFTSHFKTAYTLVTLQKNRGMITLLSSYQQKNYSNGSYKFLQSMPIVYLSKFNYYYYYLEREKNMAKYLRYTFSFR